MRILPDLRDVSFIISTHSPFLLSIKGAKIYGLDENPVDIKPWTELESIRILYGFLKEFEENILGNTEALL